MSADDKPTRKAGHAPSLDMCLMFYSAVKTATPRTHRSERNLPPNASEDDEPRIYIVRLSEPAEAEVDAAYLRLMGATSFSFADR